MIILNESQQSKMDQLVKLYNGLDAVCEGVDFEDLLLELQNENIDVEMVLLENYNINLDDEDEAN